MAKELDLSQSVYKLTKKYPELIDILKDLGFTEITNTAMRHSVGKFMTIPKGATMKGIDMMAVVARLMQEGFSLTGTMPAIPAEKPETKEETPKAQENKAPEKPAIALESMEEGRLDKLKSYLKRLGSGEELEAVRQDFVENFSSVDAREIMNAEQSLMKDGVPVEQVRKLCDVHSALFKGKTGCASDSPEVQKSTLEDRTRMAQELAATPGHPLSVLYKENEALKGLLAAAKERDDSALDQLSKIGAHYHKKGDLLYPILATKYDITGPSNVMWALDVEIRQEISALAKKRTRDAEWNVRLEDVLTRAEEMIAKEENILYPIASVTLTDEDWQGIYRDMKDYALCFGVEREIWEEAEQAAEKAAEDRPASVNGGDIVLAGGTFTLPQLTALLNTIPLEITFVDADDINRFFNEGPKVFKRPLAALGREVYSCHPPKVEPIVRTIIDDFKNKRRDEVAIWMDRGGKPFLVKYMAVRDKAGAYMGTMELVQDMSFAKEHFLKGEEK